jgi:EmrB/QacA subfamily drug resistance transporter
MPDPRRWWTLGVLCLSLVVISLDNTILNVALPTLERDLDASSGQLQWIVDAYMLVFAGLLLAAGSLGDRYGRKRLLTIGLVIFGAGSAAASLMRDPTALIACRALMGVGGAAIMPSTLAILTAVFPADERPKAIGIWAGVSSVGIVIGPIAGGALVEYASWSWVFLVNVPIVLVALALGRRLIPESLDARAPRLDVRGAALSIGALVALVWGIIEAPDRGWTDPAILGAAAVFAVLIAAFVAVERRVAEPMLDLALLRNARFSAASAGIALAFMALFGVMFLLTQYLQVVLGRSALSAGLWTMPAAAGMMLGAPQSPRLAARAGTKLTVAAGLLLCTGGLAWLAQAGAAWGFVDLLGPELLLGLGLGVAMAPATDAIMGSLPLAHASVGSAVNDTNRVLGGALGVAILGSVLTSGYRGAMDGATHGLPAAAAGPARDSAAGAMAVAERLGGASGRALHAAASSAFVDAMATATLVAAAITLLGAVVALRWLPAHAAPADAVATPPAPAPVGVAERTAA